MMAEKIYRHVIDNSKINSVNSVIIELTLLQHYLDGTKLHYLTFFNQVYIFVNRELESAMIAGLFSYPKLVGQLDIAFSLHYFEALNYFCRTQKLPELWGTVAKKGIFSPFYFLLGANVHINHDLPLAIVHSIPNLPTFKKDFYTIDKIIAEAIKKFLKEYTSTGKFGMIKYVAAFIVRRPVIFIIVRWRHKAWRNAELMVAQKLTQSDLVKETTNVSGKLIEWGTFF